MIQALKRLSVSQSVSLSVTRAGCAKTAERIVVLFGVEISVLGTHISYYMRSPTLHLFRGFNAAFANLLRSHSPTRMHI